MKRVLLQPAYVLHRRPYRESSFLVELFTPEYGRMGAIAKGAHKPRSVTQGLVQPFIPLLVSWTGAGELMTLTHFEATGTAMRLQGNCLYAGFYLNELLMGLLQKWDAHPNLYAAYETTLTALQAPILEERNLRTFEKYLLDEIGYGLLPKSGSTQDTLSSTKTYRFIAEQGLIESDWQGDIPTNSNLFSGKSLLAIANNDWHPDSLKDAKRLMRLALTVLLGTRQLNSRKLFLEI